jgi:hypothetical protein
MIRLVLLHGATFIAAAGGKTPLKQVFDVRPSNAGQI